MIILFLTLFLSQGDIGTTMYPLLKIGVGPRPVALGETYVALADDITASYWNVAGLAHIEGLQFFVSHHEWFLDIRDEYLTIGMPGLKGYFALAVVYSSIRDVEIWDENNMPAGTENVWSGIVALSYGRSISDKFSIGLGIKNVYEDLYEEHLNDFAFDVGSQLKLSETIFLGGSLRNVSYTLSIPTDMKIGLCYKGIKNTNLLLDLTAPNDNMPYASTGAEYNINQYVSVRAGWRSGPYDISNLGWLSGITAGLGLHVAGLTFDYALVSYGKLGLTHRLALHGGLHIIQGTNSLYIQVMDGDSRIPLEASLALTGSKEGTYQTDKSGKFHLGNLPEGWIYIKAFVPKYTGSLDSLFIHSQGRHDKEIHLFMIKPGMFRGLVFDAVTKKPIGASITYRGMAYGQIHNDPDVGSFVLKNLPPGIFAFTVSGTDPTYIAQTCSVSIERGKLTEREFYLVKKREKIVLHGVNFATGKADLEPESHEHLDEAGRILTDNPYITVELAGHTDPREISTTTFPSNWELSLARAEVVRGYLIDNFNIDPDRLIARGYADSQPIAPNITEEDMAKNRRTEFRIIED